MAVCPRENGPATGIALEILPYQWVRSDASYVIFGSDQRLPALIDLADGADLTIQGAAVNDRSGHSVSGAGDIDGDGIDDLLIGAPGATPNGRAYAGESYVVFGSSSVAALEDLIAAVEAAGLPGGLENALTKKLSNAQGSLARGQINGAIGKIQAFINQVDAQRGNQIDEADADAWIRRRNHPGHAEHILNLRSAYTELRCGAPKARPRRWRNNRSDR